jgi:hypothetical protein
MHRALDGGHGFALRDAAPLCVCVHIAENACSVHDDTTVVDQSFKVAAVSIARTCYMPDQVMSVQVIEAFPRMYHTSCALSQRKNLRKCTQLAKAVCV